MRNDSYDVRQFNFGQLSTLVTYVATYQPQDLHVFSKYLNTAIAQEFYKENEVQKKF